MSNRLTDNQARLVRMRAQGLDRRREDPAVIPGVVRHLVGVQAQEPEAARLAMRARARGLRASDVERARVDDRSIVRTWCLRGTLHLVAAEDLGWLLALLGPALIRAGRRRRAELGLDAETAGRGLDALRRLLADHGPRTRAEIAGHLAPRGIPTAGQAAFHLIGLAALEGLLVYGPDRDGMPTFVALDGWIRQGPTLAPDIARAELARRYIAAYGPAAAEDLSTWSGLAVGEARAAVHSLADELLEVEVRGRPAWIARGHAAWLDEPLPSLPVVRLVPGYDPYLLGYRGRDLAVQAEYARRIHPGGGLLHPALLVDGLARGTWRVARRRPRAEVAVEPFDDLGGLKVMVEQEAQDVTRFLEG